jgi:hypothetical protein
VAGHGDDLLEDGWGFTPKCQMDDAERFRGCLPLTALCSACGDVRTAASLSILLVFHITLPTAPYLRRGR